MRSATASARLALPPLSSSTTKDLIMAHAAAAPEARGLHGAPRRPLRGRLPRRHLDEILKNKLREMADEM
jgi:hypothetical protein